MDQILSRPEVQSALIPFISALLIYLGLKKITATAWLWALLVAFVIAASLINGLTITPLTGTRKIILLMLVSLAIAIVGVRLIKNANIQLVTSAVLAILAILWVFLSVITRKEPIEAALILAGITCLIVWLVWMFDRIHSNYAQHHGAGLSLMLGTGLAATAGSSALLGQLALSLGAACGGFLFGWVFMGKNALSGSTKTLSSFPYILAAVLFGLAAVIFARTPWYALIALASIPLLTSLVPPVKSGSRFLNALLSTLPGLIVALGVAFWIWQSTSSSSSSGY